MSSFWLKSFLSVFLAVSVVPAWAVNSQGGINLTGTEGTQAQQQLITAAKKEGSLVLYTSIASPVSQRLSKEFHAKYGIEVKLWRSGDRAVLQRVISEAKAGVNSVDVVNIGALEMEMLHREEILQPVQSAFADQLIPDAIAPHKEWVSTFVNPVVVAYNTDKVKKEDLPKTYQDLLDPKWKGLLGVEGSDEEWFYAIAQSMGREKGLQFFRDLVATNGLSVRNGHSLLNNLVVAGEVPMGISAYGHMAVRSMKTGAPINYVMLDPVVGDFFSMGIAAKSAHPNAAALFYQYMLADGQKVFADMNYIPTRKDIDTPFKNVKFLVVDKSAFLDVFNEWSDLWDQIIVQKK